jgi:hypothetical protein
MTAQHLLRYLRQPDLLAELSPDALRSWTERYPYSANLRLLTMLRARMDKDPKFEGYLADFAAATFDRAYLYQLLEDLRLRDEDREEVLELVQLDDLELAPLDEAEFEELPSRINHAIPDPAPPEPKPEPTLVAPPPGPVVDRPRREVSVAPLELAEWIASATTLSRILCRDVPRADRAGEPTARPRDPEYFDRQPRGDSDRELRNRLMRLRKRRESGPLGQPSTFDRGEIASETLAELLVRQQQYPRAIRMYRRLVLLYPEKKAIFARQIQELKEKL